MGQDISKLLFTPPNKHPYPISSYTAPVSHDPRPPDSRIQTQRIIRRLLLPRNRLLQLLVMPIHLLRLLRRILQRVRRPEHPSHERIDQSTHGRRDGLEPFADRPSHFAQGALDFVAGGVAKVAGGGEQGA